MLKDLKGESCMRILLIAERMNRHEMPERMQLYAREDPCRWLVSRRFGAFRDTDRASSAFHAPARGLGGSKFSELVQRTRLLSFGRGGATKTRQPTPASNPCLSESETTGAKR